MEACCPHKVQRGEYFSGPWQSSARLSACVRLQQPQVLQTKASREGRCRGAVQCGYAGGGGADRGNHCGGSRAGRVSRPASHFVLATRQRLAGAEAFRRRARPIPRVDGSAPRFHRLARRRPNVLQHSVLRRGIAEECPKP
eukprot:scaffold20566_cov135-Isochrysis_galbana.AAC.6